MQKNILIVTVNSWDDNKSIGNTLTNLFGDCEGYNFFNIYLKDNFPNNKICKSYFQLDGYDSFKNFLRENAGFSFTYEQNGIFENNDEKHLNLIAKKLFTGVFRELIITLSINRNKKIIEYVKDSKADIIFVPVAFSVSQQKIVNYLEKHTDAKIVMFHMDDTYSLKQFFLNPFTWIFRFFSRYYTKKNVLDAGINYVISDKQRETYARYFNREFKILYKQGDFSKKPDSIQKMNTPLKIVYTGNVLPSRWKTLVKLGRAIHKINSVNGVKIQLFIYTRNKLSKKIYNALSFDNSIFIMGSLSSNEVPIVQQKADILLHTESFSLKDRLDVRLSFSTKLVDYFHQAKCIFAVGPKEVASMDYLIRNDAAITATSQKEIEEKLKMIIENPDVIREYGDKAWECGKKNHQIDDIQKMLKEDFEKLIKKE